MRWILMFAAFALCSFAVAARAGATPVQEHDRPARIAGLVVVDAEPVGQVDVAALGNRRVQRGSSGVATILGRGRSTGIV